jgi:hypothetical protein
MTSYHRGSLVMDDARELVTVGAVEGSPSSMTCIERSDQLWLLPNELDALRGAWEARHPGEYSGRRLGIESISLNHTGEMTLRVRPTEWREVRAWQEVLPNPLDGWLSRQPTETPKCPATFALPTFFAIHAVVVSADGAILLGRRAQHLVYHPGRWSASFEEGAEDKDWADRGDIIRNCTVRGLEEEFGLQRASLAGATVRIVSVILEQRLRNPAVVVLVDVPFPRAALAQAIPNPVEVAGGGVATLPLTVEAIASWRREFERDPTVWHPTARYRLLKASSRRLGASEAVRLLV